MKTKLLIGSLAFAVSIGASSTLMADDTRPNKEPVFLHDDVIVKDGNLSNVSKSSNKDESYMNDKRPNKEYIYLHQNKL